MPHVTASDRPVLWAVEKNNEVIAAGVMAPGGLTVTGDDKALLSDTDENAFLGKVAGKAGDFTPLPDAGTPLEAGAIYAYGNDLVLVRQNHTRTEHEPADVPALFSVYRDDAGEALDWIANEPVWVGTRRLYAGKLYEATTEHTTQADWTPDATPALWREVVETPEAGPQPWVQPSGAQDAYNAGDRVTFEGSVYESLIDANVWSPSAYPAGWTLIGPA